MDNFVDNKIGSEELLNIFIIAVGKLKEAYLKAGISEYLKRLKVYANVEVIEVTDEPTPQNASEKQETQIKAVEGERILEKIPEHARIVALDIKGKNCSSEEFAQKLNEQMIYSGDDLVFIIGGSLGLSGEVLAACHQKISFGKMTYPHQLMRLILIEQIYRSFKIIRGEPYHK